MEPETLLQHEWPYLLTFLPSEDYLEGTAKAHGALVRKRNVDRASDLIRLAFAYAFCGMSFRHTAAWATLRGIADLSDVALLKRLRSSADWFGHLLALKLAERATPIPSSVSPTRIRLIDATCITKPGSTGLDWRIHFGFDLSRWVIDHIELTDYTGGETLNRFTFSPGELIIADRGYSSRTGLHKVINAHADFLIRLSSHTPKLLSPTGHPFDMMGTLRDLPDAEPGDFPVILAASKNDKLPALPVRVLAVRKTEHAAARARKIALHESARRGHITNPLALEATGYIVVVTSLRPAQLGTAQALDLYRFRWQIELLFKPLKSILDLGNLPAKDPPLVRTILYVKLLAALLIEEWTEHYLDFSPWGYRLEPSPGFDLAHSMRPH